MLRRFKSDRDETWQECSPSKHASIDAVGFLIRRPWPPPAARCGVYTIYRQDFKRYLFNFTDSNL